jgi:excisionase family DNA binding protein
VQRLYLTLKEVADFLDLPEEYLVQCIQEKKIRAIYDGEQYLLNQNHFKDYHEQMKQLMEQFELDQNEPIPDDFDVKDED